MTEPLPHPPAAAAPVSARKQPGRFAAVLFIVTGALIVAAAAALSLHANRPPGQLPAVGQPLPDFSLPALSGGSAQLSSFGGRPVLINFWASWCPPCRVEMLTLEELYAQQAGSDLLILGINSGESPAAAARFVRESGVSFPILLDSDSALSARWLINSLPTTILVGRDGTVKVIHVGLMSAKQMQDRLGPHLQMPAP